MLKIAGFDDVEEKLGLPADEVRKPVREFGSKNQDADVAVIYYAEHGIELDGINYLIPVKARVRYAHRPAAPDRGDCQASEKA